MGSLLVFSKKVEDLTKSALRTPVAEESDQVLDRLLSAAADQNLQISLLMLHINRLLDLLLRHKKTKAHRLVTGLLSILIDQTPDHVYVDCCRFNEITLLLPGVQADAAMAAAEEIRQRFQPVIEQVCEKERTPVSLKGAIASFPQHGQNRHELLRSARDTLFLSSQSEEDKIMIHQPGALCGFTLEASEIQMQRLQNLSRQLDLAPQSLLQEALEDLLLKYAIGVARYSSIKD